MLQQLQALSLVVHEGNHLFAIGLHSAALKLFYSNFLVGFCVGSQVHISICTSSEFLLDVIDVDHFIDNTH